MELRNTMAYKIPPMTSQNEISSTIARLQQEQNDLHSRIQEMDRALYLTPRERSERKNLHEMTLQKKEQIQTLQNRSF